MIGPGFKTFPIGRGRGDHVRNQNETSQDIREREHHEVMSESSSDIDDSSSDSEPERIKRVFDEEDVYDVKTRVLSRQEVDHIEKITSTMKMNGKPIAIDKKSKDWEFYETLVCELFMDDVVAFEMMDAVTTVTVTNQPFRPGKHDKIIVVLEGNKVTLEGTGDSRVEYISRGSVVWFMNHPGIPVMARFEGDFKIVVFQNV